MKQSFLIVLFLISPLHVAASNGHPDIMNLLISGGSHFDSTNAFQQSACDLLDMPAVSERDEADLRFGVAQGVDMVFASFIRSAQDVKEVRRALGERGHAIKVISKVESRQGVQK